MANRGFLVCELQSQKKNQAMPRLPGLKAWISKADDFCFAMHISKSRKIQEPGVET